MLWADALNSALSFKQSNDKLIRMIADPRKLRDSVRKSIKFKLDDKSSAMIADASVSVAKHCDEARQIARPPFPLTWIEFNNTARVARGRELGISDAHTMKIPGDEPVPHVAWLIERHQSQHSAYMVTYVSFMKAPDDGRWVTMALPWSWGWDVEGKDCPWEKYLMPIEEKLRTRFDRTTEMNNALVWTLLGSQEKCESLWMLKGYGDPEKTIDDFFDGMTAELAGEVRHIFGLLALLSETKTEEKEYDRSGEVAPIVAGKPVNPLIYRDVSIRLNPKQSVARLVTRAVEGVRHRRHPVRGHQRHYKNGTVKWIEAHERGDEKLGRVVRKTYQVKGE